MRAKLLIAFELVPITNLSILFFQDFSRAETFLSRCGTSQVFNSIELRVQFSVVEKKRTIIMEISEKNKI